MAERILGPTGSPRRRRFLFVPFLAVIAVALLAIGTAQGLTQSAFELDKDATNNIVTLKLGVLKAQINNTNSPVTFDVCTAGGEPAPATPFNILIDAEQMTVTNVAAIGGGGCNPKQRYTATRAANGSTATTHAGAADVSLLSPNAPAGDDWDQVFEEVSDDPDTKCTDLGALECAFTADPKAGETSYFTGGGSKDDLDIPNWLGNGNSVPPSDEILDAMAAKYDVAGNQILFFGADRDTVNGAKDFGFWFFHDEVSFDPATGAFTGQHTAHDDNGTPGDLTDDTSGDILILSTFTNGGATANVRVFEWVGTGGNATANGTVNGPVDAMGDCVPGIASDNGCVTVNNTSIVAPWPYRSASANFDGFIPAGGFVEGAIDLTALGLEGCFSSFLAETRSSPSVDSQLKDFVLGEFEACGSETATTPEDSAGADIPADGLSITTAGSIQVQDEATVTVNGTNNFAGDVTFFLCFIGTDTTSTDTCSDGEGTQIGDPVGVTGPSPATVDSALAEITSAGRYCWRAVYSGDEDEGVPGSADVDSETECFKVNPVQPTLDTEAVDENGAAITTALPFGSTIYDQATLTGTANQPGDPVIEPTTPGGEAEGTITFKLYGPLDPDNLEASCDTLAAGFPADGIVVDVSGDSPPAYGGAGSTPPVSFVPQGPGVYHWKAVYSGDLPNTLGDDHNADCDDSAESVTIQQLQPTMDTAQSFVPNDSATITVDAGAGDLDGSVVFQLFVDDADCSEAPAYTSDPIDVSDTDDPGDTSLSDTVESANTTSYNVNGTTFHWVVAFTSDNPAHLGVTSGCGNETSSITIDNGDTQPPAGP